MSSEEAFLRAIQEEPDDDLPRLVLADWLDDHGDAARAEFVRAQLELARGVGDPVRHDRLLARERDLLLEHRSRWLGPFADAAWSVWRYTRGTACVRLPTRTLLEEQVLPLAAEWFPRGWALELSLRGQALRPLQLFEQPWLGQLTRLALEAAELDGRLGVDYVVRCPYVQRLTGLSLCHNQVSPVGIAALDEGLPRLRELNLSGNRLERGHIEALLRLERLKDLVSLQLAGCDLNGELVELLVSSLRLAGLQELNLSRNRLLLRGAGALAASPHLTNLRRLGLRNSKLTRQGAAVLARSAHLRKFEMIDIWDAYVGRTGISRLEKRFGAALWLNRPEPPCWSKW
jgi:uncharacterized protein (TIGR02996 family)